jgi:hypothetical protein
MPKNAPPPQILLIVPPKGATLAASRGATHRQFGATMSQTTESVNHKKLRNHNQF